MAVGVAAGWGRVLDPQEWKEISFSSKEEEKEITSHFCESRRRRSD